MMNGRLFSMAMAALIFAACSTTWAGGDVETGKATFEASCAECHFEDDFAGEAKEDIAALINGVASGEVEHKGEATELTPEDIAALTAYFASFE